MSHNIKFNKERGTFNMFSLKERPWHGLGTIVQEAPNSEQAIKLANLDFEVAKGKGYLQYIEEDRIIFGKNGVPVDNTFFTYRRDNGKVLMENGTAVTNTYTVVQNVEAFTFFDSIIGHKDAIFETAGALDDGQVIFITAKLPNFIRIKGSDDIIEKYLLFTSSHDGSGMVKALFTPIRVVCENTLNMALQGQKCSFAFKHTKSVKDKLTQGAEILGLHNVYITELNEILNRLSDISVADNDVIDIITDLILTPQELTLLDQAEGKLYKVDEISTRKKNTIKDLNRYVESGVGQTMHRGSAYWLYNGISSYYNNGIEYDTQAEKFDSVISGHSNKQTQKAFNLVIDKFLN